MNWNYDNAISICIECGKNYQLTEQEKEERIKVHKPLNKCDVCARKHAYITIQCKYCKNKFNLYESARQKRNQRKDPLDLCTTCLNIQKNGYANVSQRPEVKEKKENNNVFSRKEFKENNKKYWQYVAGVDNPSQIDVIKERKKQTCLENTGYDNPQQVPEIRKKSIITKIKKYKTPYPQLLTGGHSQKERNIIKQIKEIFTNGQLKDKGYIVITDPREIFKITNSHHFDCAILKNNQLEILLDYDGQFYHAYGQYEYNGLQSREENDTLRLLDIPKDVKHHIIIEGFEKEGIIELIKLLGYDYQLWIKRQLKWCITNGFPYPMYTKEELIASWNNLLKYKAPKDRFVPIMGHVGIGDKLIYHFHENIYDCKLKGKISPSRAWNDIDLLRKCIENRFIYVNNVNPSKVLQGFTINKIAPRVSVFSAARAKILIEKYLNEYDTIFDPFSGFSGRLLGAISLNRKYIGQDINQVNVNESNFMLKEMNFKCDATVICKDIMKSTGTYDCLFTCPPYGDKEQWWDGFKRDYVISHKTCDEWIDECLKRFKCKTYLFVVDNTIKYKKYIVQTLPFRSHLQQGSEKVILIKK